uniref:Uncharacterized protein n=1 Tax=Nai virus TaxID=2081617 RepID=A0A2L1CCZ1_9VIRU|nr:hypothetical protein [Nai virus]
MRFGPQFTNLPTTVPEELYVSVKAPVPKAKILESPNVDQQRLIRSLARMLPEAIWCDPAVFPQREAVLLAISQLSEHDTFVGGWLDSSFTCVPTDDGRLALFNKKGQELVVGHSGEIIHYAKEFCRKAMPAIVLVHRMGFVVHPNLTGVLAEDLELFRQVRAVSRGLDRISKIEELDNIDQDATINKFMMGGLPVHKTVYHLGAGSNLSSSQRALSLSYDTVVLVDPRCKNGVNSKSATWQEIIDNIPPDADIVSDVAYGDDTGMLVTGYKELVDRLYTICENRLVMVKCPLQLGYNAKGVVHCKPRPHNLEIVFILDPDGDDLDLLYEEYAPDVVMTNKERNRQILCMTFNARIKDVANTSKEITQLMSAAPPTIPKPKETIKTPRRSRNVCLAEAGAKKGAASKRHLAWFKIIKDKDFNFDGPSAKLPPAVGVRKGRITQQDPGLPDVGLSLRSLRVAALKYGYRMEYHNNCWNIV